MVLMTNPKTIKLLQDLEMPFKEERHTCTHNCGAELTLHVSHESCCTLGGFYQRL